MPYCRDTNRGLMLGAIVRRRGRARPRQPEASPIRRKPVNRAACAIAAALTIAAPGLAAAQDKPVQLKLSHWVPPSHPLQKAMEDWGASVAKDSGGTITYKVFPAQQLG